MEGNKSPIIIDLSTPPKRKSDEISPEDMFPIVRTPANPPNGGSSDDEFDAFLRNQNKPKQMEMHKRGSKFKKNGKKIKSTHVCTFICSECGKTAPGTIRYGTPQCSLKKA